MIEKNYKELLEFISYFEDDSIEFCKWQGSDKHEDGVYSMAYPIYDDKINEFIQVVYDSGIMLEDYMSFLNDKIGSDNDPIRVINDTDDIDTLLAVLTYFVRQERFHDGLWGKAVEDKIFLNILLRLRGITNEKCK